MVTYSYIQVKSEKCIILMTAGTPTPQTGADNHPSEGSRQAAAQGGKARRHLRSRAPWSHRGSSARVASWTEIADSGKGLLSSRGGSSGNSRRSRWPRLPEEPPQPSPPRPAPPCPPTAPRSARPTAPTCVAAARSPPPRGPAALPRLRAGE